MNKEMAKEHLETALGKASEDPKLEFLVKDISGHLVRVYQQIAYDAQQQNNYEEALQYYEKCLEVAKKAQNELIEAECYQRIGLIYHELD